LLKDGIKRMVNHYREDTLQEYVIATR
jgi:hypothetical protein